VSKATPMLEPLELRGLELAPSQVYGGVRLVPVLRREVREDLRLGKREYRDDAMVVSLDGELMAPGVKYISYVPHGLVMSWSDDGSPAAAFGTQLQAPDGKRLTRGPFAVRVAHRMARREAKNQLRFLPLHLAMEGFLALHFGGPQIAWTEYSRQALTHGLDPRSEGSVSGAWIHGLEDALRVFEIHTQQVGVLVFVADALASAFVVPHPEDYALLHRSLIADFYGPLLYQYSLHATALRLEASINAFRVSSLAELRAELGELRAEWSQLHHDMSRGLLGKGVHRERVYRAGPFQLQRFITALDLADENHLGEAIVRDSGELEYLKTYRLSAAQSRRAFLLQRLAAHQWNLDATAASFGQSKDELVRRMEKAGFGYLLKPEVLAEARKRR
jgi:hypothetical protein